MQITPDVLQTFLSSHLQVEISHIEPVRHGEWSQTFFFRASGQKKVIRFSAFPEDFRKDAFAARFSSPSLPVPAIQEIGEAFDLFFAISNYVDGKLIDHFSAAEMQAAVPALMSLLNALREVDASQTRGYGGFGADGNGSAASWQEYLTQVHSDSPGSRLGGWRENLSKNKEAEAVYQQGTERLRELIPLCPEERHLVHNDLLHFNLIMQEQRVAAVIDWGNAMWGDFLYDLAMFTTWQFYYPNMAGIDFANAARQVYEAYGAPLSNFDERLGCYQLHLLLDSVTYNAWKEDRTNFDLTIQRLKEFLTIPGSAA